ncbi:hypothetical protein [Tsuneonella sp. HG222]
MNATIRKIGSFYAKAAKTGLIFAFGFFAGILFTGFLLGMYGYNLDTKAMPSTLTVLTPS